MRVIEVIGTTLTLNVPREELEYFGDWHKRLLAAANDTTTEDFTEDGHIECGFLLFMASATRSVDARNAIGVHALNEIEEIKRKGIYR